MPVSLAWYFIVHLAFILLRVTLFLCFPNPSILCSANSTVCLMSPSSVCLTVLTEISIPAAWMRLGEWMPLHPCPGETADFQAPSIFYCCLLFSFQQNLHAPHVLHVVALSPISIQPLHIPPLLILFLFSTDLGVIPPHLLNTSTPGLNSPFLPQFLPLFSVILIYRNKSTAFLISLYSWLFPLLFFGDLFPCTLGTFQKLHHLWNHELKHPCLDLNFLYFHNIYSLTNRNRYFTALRFQMYWSNIFQLYFYLWHPFW